MIKLYGAIAAAWLLTFCTVLPVQAARTDLSIYRSVAFDSFGRLWRLTPSKKHVFVDSSTLKTTARPSTPR